MFFDSGSFYHIYLPVADVTVDGAALIAIGLSVGFLAGICGIGGSILLLPILLALNIPTHVAVTMALNQVLATSLSTTLVYKARGLIDYKFGILSLCGSMVGIAIGMGLYYALASSGKLEICISIAFLITLIFIGTFSAREALILLYHKYKKTTIPAKPIPQFVQNLGLWKTDFLSFKERISAIFPVSCGMLSGAMVSFMGLGGSLVMSPILIYGLGMLPSYAIGTVNFQMIFTTLISYYIHAVTSNGIDLILSIALLIGAVFGAQIGAKVGSRLSQETFKTLLAIVILILCTKLGIDLFAEPTSLYQVEILK